MLLYCFLHRIPSLPRPSLLLVLLLLPLPPRQLFPPSPDRPVDRNKGKASGTMATAINGSDVSTPPNSLLLLSPMLLLPSLLQSQGVSLTPTQSTLETTASIVKTGTTTPTFPNANPSSPAKSDTSNPPADNGGKTGIRKCPSHFDPLPCIPQFGNNSHFW